MNLTRSISIVKDLQNYRLSWFRDDLVAGITVSILLIPQAIAYGMLAGLPPIYGLYAAFIPLLIYPVFGSSKELSVGPVAIISIMILSGLSGFATPGSADFVRLAILTALVAGFIQLLLAWLRFGFLVGFLSEPVISGFTAAAAVIISVSQLKHLLGIDLDRSTNLFLFLKDLAFHLHLVNWPSLMLGVGSLIFIVVLKKIHKAIPTALLAALIGSLLVYFLSLDQSGVSILGSVPRGLPSFDLSFFKFADIPRILPLALAICLISFIESLAIAKTIAAKNDHYPINANKELLGLGLGKILGAFFQAYPSTGSFSRSAINNESGARTGISSVIAGLIVGLALLFLTGALYYLPNPVLAAIIISAVIGLLNFPYAKRLFHLDRVDFYVYLTTFLLTLMLGVQQGVFAGVGLSMIMILFKSSRPHYAVLGRLPGSDSFRNVNRFDEAEVDAEVLIVRYDDDLYFGNADHFYESILSEVDRRKNVKILILNAGVISRIDSTGLHHLELLLETLNKKGIRTILTHLRGPVRDLLAKSGLADKIGSENYFLNIKDAVDSLATTEVEIDQLRRKYANQKNKR